MTTNTNTNTQNNNQKVVVNVQTAPRRRAPRRRPVATPPTVPPHNTTVVSPTSTSIYYPHQATSLPSMGPVSQAFQTASTNRDVTLAAMANDAQNQQTMNALHNAYAQNTVPSLANVPIDTTNPAYQPQ